MFGLTTEVLRKSYKNTCIQWIDAVPYNLGKIDHETMSMTAMIADIDHSNFSELFVFIKNILSADNT